MATAVVVGLVVRLRYVAVGDFPMGDGGFFYTMVRDLQHNHYTLPRTSSYNGLHIPFAYPPLGLYVTALVSDLTHLPVLRVMQFLPALLNLGTIAGVYLIARELLPRRMTAATAALCFAFMPAGFEWTIMGGGITRSLGFLLGTFAVWQLILLSRNGAPRNAIAGGALGGLALASHLEFGIFAGLTGALLLLLMPRRPGRIRVFGLAAGCCALAAAPWIVAVVARDGPLPLLNAARTGSSAVTAVLMLVTLQMTAEPVLPLLGLCALTGAVHCFMRGERFLPLWFVVLFLVEWRGAKIYGAVPLALLAAVGIMDCLLPRVRRLHLPAVRGKPVRGSRPRGASTVPAAVVATLLVAALVWSALEVPTSFLGSISRNDRAAMQWSAANMPPGSRVLVIGADGSPSDPGWSIEADRLAEWFPALTDRTSVTTYEGYEWLGGFLPAQRALLDAMRCVDKDSNCLDAWTVKTQRSFSYAYVAKPPAAVRDGGRVSEPSDCCRSLRTSLRGDPRYATIYDGPGATIFVRGGR